MKKRNIKTLLLALGLITFSSCSFNITVSNNNTSDISSNDNISIINPTSEEENSSEIESVFSENSSSEEISSEEYLSSEEISSNISSEKESSVSSYVSSSGFTVSESGRYKDVESVAMYLVTYHKLPSNYVKKSQASNYDNSYSIGGDYFGNREGYLPSTYNGSYRECDIGSTKNSRGAKRIVYETRTYRIFYTTDHYENFREYYGYKSWSELFGECNDIY